MRQQHQEVETQEDQKEEIEMIKEKLVKMWNSSSDVNNEPYIWGCNPQSKTHR